VVRESDGSVRGSPRGHRRLLAGGLVLVFVIALVMLLLVQYYPRRRRRFEYPRDYTTRGRLRMLSTCCLLYQAKWGVLPHDPRGEAEALYKLREIVGEESPWTFDVPTEGGEDVTGPARFDERTERVVGCDFEYLNWPTAEGLRVLFATQWWANSKKRHLVVMEGFVRTWEPSSPGEKPRLVGRVFSELWPPERAQGIPEPSR